MREFHAEPYIYLPTVTHKSALIAWGAFYFRVTARGKSKLVDWFFTYFQPYRYVINRVPVYPSIGNHDAAESEEHDDRAQVEDNFYIRERILGEEAAGRASFGPGLFYRFRFGSAIEFVCFDTSKEDFFEGARLFDFPKHAEWVECAFPAAADGVGWRFPFGHHPPFSAGPRHHNTRSMARLLPRFARSGVRAVFSGHEHNFQHSKTGGIDYFVTGAGGKFRDDTPGRFEEGTHGLLEPSLPFFVMPGLWRSAARPRDSRAPTGRSAGRHSALGSRRDSRRRPD